MPPAPKKHRPVSRRGAPVSDQLRAIIRARNLTPYAVATLADVSPSVLSRFMKGERGLTTDTFDAICAALGLELETRRGRAATGARQVETGPAGEPDA